MPAKLTAQEFIDRARAVHGDKYDYSFSVYRSSKTKVFIHCPEHGMFEQSPANHLSGAGCPGCANKNRAESKKLTTELFIQKARETHGNRYGYAFSVYISSTEEIMIYCPEHGMFEQIAASHLSGKGCSVCSGNKKHDNDSFIEKAIEVHGDKYDYSMVNYTGNKNKVKIVCPEHGVFEQRPKNHINGRGCLGCASFGFDITGVGFLYVLRSDCGQYMKIGITNNPERRHTELTRDTPFSFKRIELIECPGEQIANLEKELLAEYQPVEFDSQFNGYSEWRLWDDSVRGYLV